MKVHLTQTDLPDLIIVDVDHFSDERGFFMESWNKREFADAGLDADFVQDNHSRSSRGVLRGLHYQDMTAPLGKLVRCTFGAIFDVGVDLRVGSPRFGRWFGIELTAENKRQLYVPAGFAHGFATLSEFAEVQYKQTGYYAPAAEGVLLWNDPEVAIEWPIENPLLSKRDQQGMSLRQYLEHPAFRWEG
jgi:dTDP-4-dehydrorhamnose 3,5-epimerase